MSEQRTPPVVTTAILDAAERAVTEVSTEDPATELTLREVLRAMLAIVLPMYELRLGAELGRLTPACLAHPAPKFDADCARCQRYTALVGARRLIEGRTTYQTIFGRTTQQEADDGGG